jgi:hypothetical protein
VASVATVAILYPQVVPQAVGISTAFFTNLADSVRQVLAR